MVNRSVSENDLHAFVDGHLTRERGREVVAYLATDPPAAERARAFYEQKEALAALRHSLADGQAGPPWPGFERALGRKMRAQRRSERQ
jgi:anti-sigma factor RsiW